MIEKVRVFILVALWMLDKGVFNVCFGSFLLFFKECSTFSKTADSYSICGRAGCLPSVSCFEGNVWKVKIKPGILLLVSVITHFHNILLKK